MNDYLMHFNPNHDPRNGRFTKNSGYIKSQDEHSQRSVFKKRVVSNDNEKVEFYLKDNSELARILAKIFPSTKHMIDNAFSYDIKNKKGKTVGHMELERLSKNTIYGNWISIK